MGPIVALLLPSGQSIHPAGDPGPDEPLEPGTGRRLPVLLGEATEHLADRVGPGLGGFMNATFGNATELIVEFGAAFKQAAV